jgi:hypothetical protein
MGTKSSECIAMKAVALIALVAALSGCISDEGFGQGEEENEIVPTQEPGSEKSPSKILWQAEGNHEAKFTIENGDPEVNFVFVQENGALVTAYILSGSCSGIIAGPQANEVGQFRSTVECSPTSFPATIAIQIWGDARGFVEVPPSFTISMPS